MRNKTLKERDPRRLVTLTGDRGQGLPAAKTMKTSIIATIAAVTALSATAQGTTNLALNWFTWDGGGGTSSNSFGRLQGTIGQPDAGALVAANFTLEGGFWAAAGVGAAQSPGAPWLSVFHTSTNTVCVCWPLPDDGWKLQATTNLSDGRCLWSEIAPPYQNAIAERYYVEPWPVDRKYYRLHKP
jgi:hypothetical protein